MNKINDISKEILQNFIASLRKKELIEFAEMRGNRKFSIQTMEEDTKIISELWKYFQSLEIDILEYSLHSSMIQDEDDNFLTTLSFQIIRAEN